MYFSIYKIRCFFALHPLFSCSVFGHLSAFAFPLQVFTCRIFTCIINIFSQFIPLLHYLKPPGLCVGLSFVFKANGEFIKVSPFLLKASSSVQNCFSSYQEYFLKGPSLRYSSPSFLHNPSLYGQMTQELGNKFNFFYVWGLIFQF